MTRAEAVQKVREEIARLHTDGKRLHRSMVPGADKLIVMATKLQWALDLLTAADDPVAALPGKWREEVDADALADTTACYRSTERSAMQVQKRNCAAELEAALGGQVAWRP